MADASVIVVGAGPAGLAQALYLARVRGRKVVVVEQQAEPGGNWASIRTPWGLVDRGVLIPHEIGVHAFDEVFFDLLPSSDWHILEGARRDIAGNYFRGKLELGSLYPDLRRLDTQELADCRAEILALKAGRRPGVGESRSLHEFLEARFGPRTVDLVHRPISQKFWRLAPECMSAWAGRIVHMGRVVLDGPEASLALKKDPSLDAVVSYPDQLRIPSTMTSPARAFYPKKFGLTTVVDALRASLDRAGVEILTSTQTRKLEIAGKRIASVDVLTPTGPRRLLADALLWTSPTPALGKLLSLALPEPPDAAIPHRIVHLFLDRPPNTGELYWLWSYDDANHIVRFSNYTAFCADAARGGLFPVCAETHVDSATVTDDKVIATVEAELREMSIVSPQTKVVGAAVVPGIRVYPVASVANCAALGAQREAIHARGLQNLVLSNQDVSTGRFYLADILAASVPLLEQI
jgi:phytoene dehydrogenase-like protein